MALRESDLNGYCPKRKSPCLHFGRKQDLKGERGKPIYWCMPIELTLLFFLVFFLSFSIFFLIFFLFFLLCFSFHSLKKILYFSILFSGHDKGHFIVPTVTKVLPFCPLIVFVWSGRTCWPLGLCDIHPRQIEAGLFFVPLCTVTLLPATILMLSLSTLKACTQRFPLKLASYGWSIIPTGCTSQKGLDRSRKIDLFPSPHHQTIPPLPLTSGPWLHHVLYWLGTSWWCLGLVHAFLSDMSKSLPAAHAFAVIWRLSVCISWPFMWAFLWFPAPLRGWASYGDGPYISLAHFWFSLLPTTLNCYSCRNNLILLNLFLGQPFIHFLSGLS